MQAPTIVFDHVNQKVAVVAPGAPDPRLAELLNAQRGQVTSAGGSPPPRSS
jgi:hypothetical protein